MPAGNSGEFEFVYADSTYGTHKLRFKWEETVSGLTSTVSITEAAFWSNAYGGYDCLGYFVLEVNGQDLLTVDGQGSMRISLNNYVAMNVPALPVTTSAIAHNADGTKTITVKLKKLPSGGGYTKPLMWCAGDIYGSGVLPFSFLFTDNDSVSLTLSTVSVASDFTVTGDTMGSPVTISINRADSSLTHTLTYRFSGDADTAANRTRIGSAKFTGTSVSWTPDANALGAKIPSANSGTWVLRLETYSGSTLVGTTSKNVTLSVPSDSAPTVSSGWSSIGYDNTGTAASTIAAVVKGYSKLTWALDVSKITLKYGATLASVKAVYDGTTVTKTSSGTYTLGTAASTGNTVTVTVTDSRGKTRSASFSKSAYDYAAPTIKNVNVFRCDSGGSASDTGSYVSVSAKAVISSINSLNAVYYFQASIKAAGGSYGTPTPISANGAVSRWNANMSATSSYVVKIELMDTIGRNSSPSRQTSLEITIPTASVAFNIKEGGSAAAFGKYAETDKALDIGDWTAIGRVMGLGQARAAIPANSYFSDYIEPGVYALTDAAASSISDCPSSYGGTLRVWNSIGNSSNPGGTWYYVIQEYDDLYGNTWRRRGASGSGTTVNWYAWSFYAGQLSELKGQLGLPSSLNFDYKSASDGNSVSWTFSGSARGAVIVASATTNAHDIVIYNFNSGGSGAKSQVRNATGITVTATSGVLTIQNSSGVYIYCLQIAFG